MLFSTDRQTDSRPAGQTAGCKWLTTKPVSANGGWALKNPWKQYDKKILGSTLEPTWSQWSQSLQSKSTYMKRVFILKQGPESLHMNQSIDQTSLMKFYKKWLSIQWLLHQHYKCNGIINFFYTNHVRTTKVTGMSTISQVWAASLYQNPNCTWSYIQQVKPICIFITWDI